MEDDYSQTKDELSTCTNTLPTPNESKLTLEYGNPDNDYGDTFDGDPSIMNGHSNDDKDNGSGQDSKVTQKHATLDRKQSPSQKYQQTVQCNNSTSKRKGLSRTRLSQWSKRYEKIPMDVETTTPLVEGIESKDDKHLWSEAKALNIKALLVLWWTFVASVMYIASIYDLYGDSAVAWLFYQKHRYPEYRWCMISVFVLANSYFIQCCFSYYEVTHDANREFGSLGTKKYAMLLFFFMPWIIVFIGIYDTYKNRYTRRLETAYIMMFIEVIFESIPQASLQINAICVYTNVEHEAVEIIQWCSATTSVLFLSMGIAYSVIFYNNKDAKQWIKFLFFVFGSFTIVSRILLCSSYGLQGEGFWGLPFVAGLLTTSMTWFLLRTFHCFGYKEFLTKYAINNLPMALVTASSWITSFIFNCFSPSGIPVSVLMLVFAVVDFSVLKSPLPQFEKVVPLINICLTSFVLLCNIVFAFVPKCKILSKTWIDGEGEDEDDPYHFRFY